MAVRDISPGERLHIAIARVAQATGQRPPTQVSHQDADDDQGSIATDDAIGFDPIPVLRALERYGARPVVMGQVAGILHGSEELTGDLDLLWSGRPADAPAMAAAFRSLDARLTDDGGVPAEDEHAFALPKVLFRTATAAGDCCTPRLPWKGLPIDEFIARAVTDEVDGVIVRYLTIDDLIAMRLLAGRPKDLRRATELQRIVRGST